MVFHDAAYCYQHWLSCATCHPSGRVDGLNWDLLNDGIGNPKNTVSLLLSHKTPPAMARGVRADMEAAVLAGFRHILFREPRPGDVAAVRAYLCSLRPDPSPHRLPGGGLTPAAERGRAIFQNNETQCATCHPAPFYTNLKECDVGTRGPLDRNDTFDTPTLVELWRTGPYLHDGSATTLNEVLTDRNRNDRHGRTSHLTQTQVEDLIAFLNSL
jgi:cytochrome c peroxidase